MAESSKHDKRFIEAVDKILADNKRKNIRPHSERAISLIISNNASTISKIRAGRSVTIDQLELFGNHFGIDFNYFFSEDYIFRYRLHDDFQHPSTFRKSMATKKVDLIYRMTDQLDYWIAMMFNIVVAFREQMQRLENENADEPIKLQSKKARKEAKKKLSTLSSILQ